MFEKGKNDKPNPGTDSPEENKDMPEWELEAEKTEYKKTTPDEGKTFDEDTVFVCVTDCFHNMIRYRRGDVLTARKCPPHFAVKPKGDNE
jgi:hypothetical protein